jgi:hypothetical protein
LVIIVSLFTFFKTTKMKKTVFTFLFLALTIALFAGLQNVSSSDDGRAGRTGAPGEGTCRDCHDSYALNAGGGSIELSGNMPNWEYNPGQTYSLSIKVARTGTSLFGFGIGAFSATNTNTGNLVVTDPVKTQIKSSNVMGLGTRRNVVHQLNGGASADSAIFNFDWVAPLTGPTTFHFAGVAANGLDTTAGDYVYKSQQVATLATTNGISYNGVFDKASVFPNPVKDQFFLELNIISANHVRLALTDIMGKLIYQYPIQYVNPASPQNSYQLPEATAPGTYILMVSTDHWRKQIPIVVK